jgi:predicted ATPase
MIRQLRINNFKAWADTGDIRMAPLTIFCGNNSSGKSSIDQFILMLKQTVESSDRYRVLHLGDKDSLVDLGTYRDIIFNHSTDLNLDFRIVYDSNPIKIFDAIANETKSIVDKIDFSANVEYDKKLNKIVLKTFKYDLINTNNIGFKLNLEQGKYKLIPENYTAIRQKGRAWQLQAPEHFFGFPDEAIAYYQNTGFLQDLTLSLKNLFRAIYYVGPLRDFPERFYQFSGEVPMDVGVKGKNVINALLAASNRLISKGYKKFGEPFMELIGRWLVQMGLINSFQVVPISEGRKEFEVRIKIHKNSPEVLITDVGFGISQILPVIVQCFYTPPQSILIFEQPEIHLHPSVQSHLGDLFIEAIHSREKGSDRNVQIIVESHSEHLIRRIQRRIAEESLRPDEVAIYFIKQEGGSAKLEELQIDIFGTIKNWPENFFGNDLEDLSQMTRAAIDRKRNR